jgi:hypothetical protein
LKEHFGIRETDPTEYLVWALAKELGCLRYVVRRPPKVGGRPRKWSPAELAELLDDFDAIKNSNLKPKIATVARRLAKTQKYAGISAKTLQNTHSLAKKGSPRLVLALSGAIRNDQTGKYEYPENDK